ncbi:MAG: glycosyltransferase family 4 protein [Bacteroidota bacterium]|nr:glycosyltransferase family 4 protein [Bacteroidota bacterium]
MQKKTILHFIYMLGRGGAETMLVRVIKELPEYNNVVVEMYGENSFGNELQCDKYLSMNLKSLFSLPLAVIKLRQIIKSNHVDMVHTHLFWPTVVARLATPKKIPLLTTIHTSVLTSIDYKHWHIRVIDKITYRIRKSVIIAVSGNSLKEYFAFLKLKPFKSHLLYTFVDIEKFNRKKFRKMKSDTKFKLVSVGALRPGKNFDFLIRVFSKLKNSNIELHIYGAGSMEAHLKKMIDECGANIILKGEVTNIVEFLPLYDLYVSASEFEGFSLSVLEAMAMKLPLLLSDIKSFREQCDDTAVYFDLNSEQDFIKKLNALIANSDERNSLSEEGQKRVHGNFTLPHHALELKKIYNESFALP